METTSLSGKQMETNNSRGKDGRKKEWLRRQKRLLDHSLRVLPSFVSQPLGPIYVRIRRVAGDAFNTAASDDTDPMRRPDGRTARQRGNEAGRHSVESWGKLHMDSPSCLVSKGPSSTIFRSLISLPNTAQKEKKKKQYCQHCSSLGFACFYNLWTDLHVCYHINLYGHTMSDCSGLCARIPACMHVHVAYVIVHV